MDSNTQAPQQNTPMQDPATQQPPQGTPPTSSSETPPAPSNAPTIPTAEASTLPKQTPTTSAIKQDATPPTTPPPDTMQEPPPSQGNPPINETPEHVNHGVSIRTIVLIVILAAVAAVLLFIAIKPGQKPMQKSLTPTATPTPSQAHSILTMTLGDSTATESSTKVNNNVVSVNVDTQTNKISGVQFEISYDPTVLTNVKVTPGTFFQKPLVLLNQVDSKNGRINYAIGIQPTADQISGTGTTAIISYTILPTASASLTTLRFLPRTQVIEQGIVGSVLKKSIDVSIPVGGLTSAVKTTPTSSTGK